MEEIIVVLWCASPLAQHLSSLVWCRERARCKDELACMANQLTHLQQRLVSWVSGRNVRTFPRSENPATSIMQFPVSKPNLFVTVCTA